MKAYIFIRTEADPSVVGEATMIYGKTLIESGILDMEAGAYLVSDENDAKEAAEIVMEAITELAEMECDVLVIPSLKTLSPDEDFARDVATLFISSAIPVFIVDESQVVPFRANLKVQCKCL